MEVSYLNKEVEYSIGSNFEAITLFGEEYKHLKLIEEKLSVTINGSGNVVTILGAEENVDICVMLFDVLVPLIDKGVPIDKNRIFYYLDEGQNGSLKDESNARLETIIGTTSKKKPIRSKSIGQTRYVDAIKHNDVVFGIGPAGTEKTFLAVVLAVNALKKKEVNKIVLVRPAVEAGEQLGFLPGDLQEKINPYLRPLYDGLYDMLGVEGTEKLIERGIIEVAPLAYMRGRTLDESFIILDEAQNTSIEQMKMFLTRFGFYSKVVITGDPTQVDLKKGETSGFAHAVQLLKDVKGIKMIYLDSKDVVRHPLVKEIIKAYEKGGK